MMRMNDHDMNKMDFLNEFSNYIIINEFGVSFNYSQKMGMEGDVKALKHSLRTLRS